MERNAHRLTLHSPARMIMPLIVTGVIDFDQVYSPFPALPGNQILCLTAIYLAATTI